jgi:hypothetical protein
MNSPTKEPKVKPATAPTKTPKRENDPWSPPAPKIKESPKA